MSRVSRWRSRCPEKVRFHQEAALNPGVGGGTLPDYSRLFLLRRSGPTAFVIKEEGKRQKLKVCLSDPHTCTCAVYQAEKELCKHICWCLLKVFRLESDDPLSYQLGLVPREISKLLNEGGTHIQAIPEVKQHNVLPQIQEGTSEYPHPRRRAAESDVCPICLENLLEKRLPVTHCRYGCGNLVHISCMLVWAKHAKMKESNGGLMLTCPLCRGDFGTQTLLKEESRNAPRMCARLRLQRQGNEGGQQQHERRHQSSENQSRKSPKVRKRKGFLPPIKSLPQNEDHTGGNMNNCEPFHETNEIKLNILKNIPRIRIHKSHRLLVRGQQCCLCLSSYQHGEYVRALPLCAHTFHSTCLKSWTEGHGGWFAVCPIDGSRIAAASPGTLKAYEKAPEGADSFMSSKSSTGHSNAASEDILQSLSSSVIVKRLSIPTKGPLRYSLYASEDGGDEDASQSGGREAKEAAVDAERKHRRAKKAPAPVPPILIQMSPRNASVESSSENAVERVETRGVARGCRRRQPSPKYPGYIPVAAVDLAAVGPCLSVKALPVQPPRTREAAAATRSPSRLSQRTPQKPEALRCHRYQNPPQPLLWSHHRAKHSHQQYGGEPRDLVAASSDASKGKLLQCSRMRLSPKSPSVRGQWDDLISWDSIEGSANESGGRTVREEI